MPKIPMCGGPYVTVGLHYSRKALKKYIDLHENNGLI